MSYANAIRDIASGSLWLGVNGCQVAVIQAAAGHVSFRRAILAELVPEREFRASFRPLYDRERIRSQFTMSLANLGEFTVYWLPEQRRILCRSVSCSRRFAVPEAAVRVGVYAEPCDVGDFFGDLDAMIQDLGRGMLREAMA